MFGECKDTCGDSNLYLSLVKAPLNVPTVGSILFAQFQNSSSFSDTVVCIKTEVKCF